MKPDGGPAFPRFELDSGAGGSVGGMSLRDYFAAAAMKAQFSFKEAIEEVPKAAKGRGMTSAQYVAFACYEIADAMLAERGK